MINLMDESGDTPLITRNVTNAFPFGQAGIHHGKPPVMMHNLVP